VVKLGNLGLSVSNSIDAKASTFTINTLDHLDFAWFISIFAIVIGYTVLSYSKVQRFLLPNEIIAAIARKIPLCSQ
jgi:hypothetical protein